jgi:hypothetical protein
VFSTAPSSIDMSRASVGSIAVCRTTVVCPTDAVRLEDDAWNMPVLVEEGVEVRAAPVLDLCVEAPIEGRDLRVVRVTGGDAKSGQGERPGEPGDRAA